MMTDSKQTKSYKLMFVDTSRAHFLSPSTRRVSVVLLPERERSGLCGRLLKGMYGTRNGKFRSGLHDHTDEHEVRGFPTVFVQTRHGDDFVTWGDEKPSAVVCERSERVADREGLWTLGGDEGEGNHIVESYRAIRTNNDWLVILGVGGRPETLGNHHGNVRSGMCRSHQHTRRGSQPRSRQQAASDSEIAGDATVLGQRHQIR